MNNNTLTVNNLEFSYHNNIILKDISFECKTGITALLGNNGAGKTTLMNILAGLQQPQKGSISFNNKNLLDLNSVKLNDIGYLPQNFEIYPNVTGYDFLSYVCDLKNLSKSEKKHNIEYVIDKFNLNSVIKSTFNKYSGGFKRRLGIAQAVIGNPKLIIIDEPTVGLDPEQRLEFRHYLSSLGENSITLISTHIIEDVELYSNNILMLEKGEIIFNGTINEIIKKTTENISTLVCNSSEILDIRKDFTILEERRIGDNEIKVKIINNDLSLPYNYNKIQEVSLENAYVFIQKQQKLKRKL